MSEPAKVRLVLCPKCENLLPELPDYSVYQCGGCGAVLRAKNKKLEAFNLPQKSGEERVQGVSEESPEKSNNIISPEKGVKLIEGSENDVNSSSFRRSDKMEILSSIADNQRNGKWVVNNDLEMNENLDVSNQGEMAKESEKLTPPNGTVLGSRRPARVADWRTGEGGEAEGFRRNPRRDVQGMKYSTSKYSEEGPSNYRLRDSHGYGEPVKNQNKHKEFNKVEYLEQDRAELLRKLDELKDQLSRTCEVSDKPKEKVPLGPGLVRREQPYGGSETWIPDGTWGLNRAPVQYSVPEAYVGRPPYVNHYPEPSVFMINRHEGDMPRFYPAAGHAPNQVHRFGDPVRPQMLGRAPHQQPLPSHPYFPRQYANSDMDQFQPYPPNMNLHQPSCSCFHCYNKHPQVLAPFPPAVYSSKLFDDIPSKTMYYNHMNSSSFGPRNRNPETSNPPLLNPHIPQSHTRWPSDVNAEVAGFVHRRPPRVVLATGGRRCRPIAGGAPLVACDNCLVLLRLPKNILTMETNQKKVQCGACSTVILFDVVNKKLIFSVHAERNSPNMVDQSPNKTVAGGPSHSRVHANLASTNFSSDDYDNSGYDFQSMDREKMSSSTGQGFYSSKSAEMRSLHSSSPYSTEDEHSSESLHAQGEESNSAEAKATPYPPIPGSPLQDHFDYSMKHCAVNRTGKGNRSGRSEMENGELMKATLRQNSMKDASLATEIDLLSNEYSNTGALQESGDHIREEKQRVNTRRQSFLSGIIKKSFKDLSKPNQTIEQTIADVTVNGRPIPDRLLKKAEKLAGPILPGQYWYDYRAGFWGVMGGPCLGIIPPFIEEFSYPMAKNCAGGSTSIFVNGRELHPTDLHLLSSRGLPTTKDRSYIIEISGLVLDEDSGEELDSLGKLAPTVEKAKHGFGMKVPRLAA